MAKIMLSKPGKNRAANHRNMPIGEKMISAVNSSSTRTETVSVPLHLSVNPSDCLNCFVGAVLSACTIAFAPSIGRSVGDWRSDRLGLDLDDEYIAGQKMAAYIGWAVGFFIPSAFGMAASCTIKYPNRFSHIAHLTLAISASTLIGTTVGSLAMTKCRTDSFSFVMDYCPGMVFFTFFGAFPLIGVAVAIIYCGGLCPARESPASNQQVFDSGPTSETL